MEKIEIDRSKWNYRKVAAWSGILGIIVAIIYIAYYINRFGEHNELWQGLLGGTIGHFF